jgi:hypothetical protein
MLQAFPRIRFAQGRAAQDLTMIPLLPNDALTFAIMVANILAVAMLLAVILRRSS